MAGWVSPYTYNGIKYTAGDAIVVNGNYYYDASDTTPNGIHNTTKYFHGVWVNDDGTLPLNPVGVRNSASNTTATGGMMRFESIVSGGTQVVYTITINMNGGTATNNHTSMQVAMGSNGWYVFNGLQPTRKGYKFKGLYTAASGGEQIYNENGLAVGDGTYWQVSLVGDGSGSVNYKWIYPGNVTLYAQWTPSSYTVNFNANGGSVSTASKSVTYNSTYGTLPTPTRSGYRFKGWYTSSSGGSQVTSSTKVTITANQTLYAQWVAVYYLDLNVFLNDSVINDTSVFHCDVKVGGSTVATNVCDYYKEHDTGSSWSISDLVTASGYTRYSTGTTSGTLTAKTNCNIYIGRNYTIIYNANGGSGAATQTVNYGTSWTTKGAICSKDGHTHTSWNTKADGTGDTYSLNKAQTATQSSNLTLYAIYTPNTYTVKYSANGGSGTMADSTATYDVAFQTRQNTFTKDGHTFNGWNEKADGTGIKWSLTSNGVYESGKTWKWAYTNDITLYAQWTPNDYTYNIVYKSSSGIELGTNSVTQLYNTTKVISPASFNGYTTPEAQSITWDSTTAKTITFIYSPIEYPITYTLNGGSVSGNPSTYTIETPTFTLKNPTKTGYEFFGWTGSNGTPSTSVSIVKGSTGEKTYTAVWEANSCYVSFDFTNNTGTIETYETSTGSNFTIPDIIPIRDGHVFKGWSKSKVGSIVDYKNGNQFIPEGSMTLYAVWELSPDYILSLDILSCWRTSRTTARLIVVSKFADLSYITSINKYPSILSSTINASISSTTLLSSSDDISDYFIDEEENNVVDEDGSMLVSANNCLEYKYELILNIDDAIKVGSVMFELTDDISTIRKSVRIAGIDSNSDDIYIYKPLVNDAIYGDDGNPIYDEDGNEIIAKMNNGGDICEAVEFIESNDMVGFQKGGRVYAKEFIESDNVMISDTMHFNSFIERAGNQYVNVITMSDGSVLIDSDGAIIRTL